MIYNGGPPVSSGVYGADGTEYRTEVETLTKVISHGTAGSGPAWLQVWTRDGLIYEYGNTSDSQIVAPGSTSVRRWAVNKVTDLFGNYYTVTYGRDLVNGSYQPSRIDYTGNAAAGVAAYNSVQFSYETRADDNPTYVGASLVRQANRLTHIKTYADSSLVRDYRIAYEISPNSARSRVMSLTECAGDGTCKPSISMGYVASPGGISQPGSALANLPRNDDPLAVVSALPGDFNGDGIQDMYYLLASGAERDPYVCYGPSFASCTILPAWTTSGTIPYVGDFDGDGISDVVLKHADGSLWLCPGPALTCQTTAFATGPVTYTYIVGDFDGDGRSDLLGWDVSSSGSPGIFCTLKSHACSFLAGMDGTNYNVYIGDFDGDGATDVLYAATNGYRVCSVAGGGTCTSVTVPMNMRDDATLLVGDFNGDGKSDVMLLTANGVSFCPDPGVMTANNCSQVPGTSGDWKSLYKVVVGDFDADGKADLMVTGAPGTQFCSGPVFSATGACTVVNSTDWRTAWLYVGDFNGDASSDLLVITSTTNQLAIGASHIPDLLGTATNTAFNTVTSFAYRPLTDTAIHTKGTTTAYPNQFTSRPFLDSAHLLRPFYVASQISRPNGIGGVNVTNFKYEKASSDLAGRGFLGFSVTHSIDVARNREAIKTIYLTFPDAHRVEKVETYAAGTLAQTWSQSFADTTTCDNRKIAAASSVLDASYGLDGVWRSEYRTYSGFDCAANATTINSYNTENSAQLKQTTTLTFSNGDGNTWGLFGRTISSVVTSYDSNQANPVTQTDTYGYRQYTNFVQQHTVEPTDPTLKVVTDNTPDAFGNLATTIISGSDIDSRTTTFGYDSRGRFRLTITNPLTQTETRTYDPRFGFVTSSTDANSIATNWTPDQFGRKAVETRPDGSQTTWTYSICCSGYALNSNLAYQISAMTTGSTQPALAYYDALDRQVLTVRRNFTDLDWIDDGNTIYNAIGTVDKSYLPYQRSASSKPFSSFTYDALGRLYVQTAPDGGTTTYAYNTTVGWGYTIGITNARGYATTYLRSARDNLLGQVVDTSGQTIYGYTALNKISSIQSPAGDVSSFTYNNRGWLKTKSDPDLGGWSYTYDRLGQRQTQTDAKSQITTFGYDKLGRMHTRTEPSLAAVWTWDTAFKGIGKLASTSTGGGITRTLGYDSLGRPSSQSLSVDGGTSTTTFTYDSAGRQATLVYPTGFFLTYSYNAPGYLSEIRNGATNSLIWRAVDMSPVGMANEDLGNGTGIITAIHPQTLRVTQIAAIKDSDGTILQNHTYSYDLAGNVASRSEITQNVSETFTYDELDRLNSVTGPAAKTLTYDVTGNIKSKSDVGTFTYPTTGQVHAVKKAGGVSYLYDANGNMTNSGPKVISWNSFNMPSGIQNGSSQYAWTYDAGLDKVKYTTPSRTFYYLSVGGAALFEQMIQASTIENRHYVYAAGRLVAEFISRSNGSSDMHYLYSDQERSTTLALDATGNVTERLSYDAHGKRRFTNGADDGGNTLAGVVTNQGFTDQEHLDELLMIHMKGRVYDPHIGRFISPDPTFFALGEPQHLNRYAYVRNNPLTLTDPTGFCEGPTGADHKLAHAKCAAITAPGGGVMPDYGGHDDPNGSTAASTDDNGTRSDPPGRNNASGSATGNTVGPVQLADNSSNGQTATDAISGVGRVSSGVAPPTYDLFACVASCFRDTYGESLGITTENAYAGSALGSILRSIGIDAARAGITVGPAELYYGGWIVGAVGAAYTGVVVGGVTYCTFTCNAYSNPRNNGGP